MRTLSSTTVVCLITAVSLIGCAEQVDPSDAYLATWAPEASAGIPALPSESGDDSGQDEAVPGDDDNPGDPATPVLPMPTENDRDGDGVTSDLDCDDNSVGVGRLLYMDGLINDTGWFRAPPQLSQDPWIYGDNTLTATGGGQQAVLGMPQSWDNVRIQALVSAEGTMSGCCDNADSAETNRWRVGLVARAQLDADQNEGYHGYRCALGSNATGENDLPFRGDSTGQFMQLAEFADAPEDDNPTECDDSPDPTFTELDRAETSPVDLTGGETAAISFSIVGNQLSCELLTTRGVVRAEAHSDTFAGGTVGFSTLNMYGKFHWITVCELHDQ